MKEGVGFLHSLHAGFSRPSRSGLLMVAAAADRISLTFNFWCTAEIYAFFSPQHVNISSLYVQIPSLFPLLHQA